MSFAYEISHRLRLIAMPLFAICLASYFGYHAIQGERGLLTWLRLSQQVEQTRATLAVTRNEERRLAVRVSQLRPESLDRDMLDERARAVLGLAAPGERIIFLSE